MWAKICNHMYDPGIVKKLDNLVLKTFGLVRTYTESVGI